MERTEIYNQFEELNKRASQGGGIDKIEKQHAAGRMTARERIEALLDKGTFNELDKFINHRCTNFGMEKKQIPGDGMVTGYGKIDGRLVFVYAYDFTVHGGSLSETNAAKIVKVQQLALKNGAPVIALNDSGGARIQEGVGSLSGYASIFYQNTIASGVIPQISAILGPCAGGASGLHEQYFVDSLGRTLGQQGHIVIDAIGKGIRDQPTAGKSMAFDQNDQRMDPYGLQTTGIQQGHIETGSQFVL